MNHDVLLTGIPRSGTTLTCSLLNRLPQVLALVETMDMRGFNAAGSDREQIRYIRDYLSAVRSNALQLGIAPVKILAGETTNTFSTNVDGKRTSTIQGDENAPHNKDLNSDFTLVLKHPNAFAALLPLLTQHFRCIALVRNPLAVLASWDSLDHPLSRGHAPMAERHDSKLTQRLSRENVPERRQLVLLDWYFQRFCGELPAGQVLRYEDVIESSGAALSVIVADADRLPAAEDLHLQSQNVNHLYSNIDSITRAAELLLADESNSCWKLYDQQAVVNLKQALLA